MVKIEDDRLLFGSQVRLQLRQGVLMWENVPRQPLLTRSTARINPSSRYGCSPAGGFRILAETAEAAHGK